MTNAAVIQKRKRSDRARRKCTECDKAIAPNTEYVQLESGESKHVLCAGVAGELPTCPECFMIVAHCGC